MGTDIYFIVPLMKGIAVHALFTSSAGQTQVDEARQSKCPCSSGEGGIIHLFQVSFWVDAIKPDIAMQLVISEITVKLNVEMMRNEFSDNEWIHNLTQSQP